MASDAQLFVWYSGHAYGMLMGPLPENLTADMGSQNGFQGTCLVPKRKFIQRGDQLEERIQGLWLEDTLFGMIQKKERLMLWCVIAACRTTREDLVTGLTRKTDQRGAVIREPVEYAHNLSLLTKQRYQFMYTCDIGEAMMDSSIFAKSFCYHLECQPASLAELKTNLTRDIGLMSFGHLRELKDHGNLPNPLEDTEFTEGTEMQTRTRKKVFYRSDMLDTMKKVKLLVHCLHEIADYETLVCSESEPEEVDLRSDSLSEEEDEENVDLNRDDSYEEYERVRETAQNIIKSFYKPSDHFEKLRHLIRLLSCDTLDEVKEVLEEHQTPSAPSSGSGGYPPCPTHWTPEGCAEDFINDQRSMLNLPELVIHAISNAIMRLKDGI